MLRNLFIQCWLKTVENMFIQYWMKCSMLAVGPGKHNAMDSWSVWSPKKDMYYGAGHAARTPAAHAPPSRHADLWYMCVNRVVLLSQRILSDAGHYHSFFLYIRLLVWGAIRYYILLPYMNMIHHACSNNTEHFLSGRYTFRSHQKKTLCG